MFLQILEVRKLIDKLRFAIDNTDNPKLLSILSKIAELSDDKQDAVLNAVEEGIFG